MPEPDLSYVDNAVYRHAAEEARNERNLWCEKYTELQFKHKDLVKLCKKLIDDAERLRDEAVDQAGNHGDFGEEEIRSLAVDLNSAIASVKRFTQPES